MVLMLPPTQFKYNMSQIIITVTTNEGAKDLIKSAKEKKANRIIISNQMIYEDDIAILKEKLISELPDVTIEVADLYRWGF